MSNNLLWTTSDWRHADSKAALEELVDAQFLFQIVEAGVPKTYIAVKSEFDLMVRRLRAELKAEKK